MIRASTTLLTLIFVGFFPYSSFGDQKSVLTYNGETHAAPVAAIEVLMQDQVSDLCWTNSKEVENRANRILLQSRLHKSQHEFVNTTLSISALGFGKNGNDCVVSYSFEIHQWGEMNDKVLFFDLYVRKSVLSGGADFINRRIMENVDSNFDEFYIELNRSNLIKYK